MIHRATGPIGQAKKSSQLARCGETVVAYPEIDVNHKYPGSRSGPGRRNVIPLIGRDLTLASYRQ